jgi:predicted metal-dependent hydrolase
MQKSGNVSNVLGNLWVIGIGAARIVEYLSLLLPLGEVFYLKP